MSLDNHWHEIKRELDALNAPILDIHRYDKSFKEVTSEVFSHMRSGGEYGWLVGWKENGPNPDWLQYGLVVNDEPVPTVADKCPTTISLLSTISGIKVAAFLTLKSNTFIPGHQHPEIRTEGLLQYHLTLNAAEKINFNYLNVNGIFKNNKRGKSIVFDGSYYHFAVNASEESRTVLYIEFSKGELKNTGDY